MVGPGPEPQRLADLMSSAWIAFARSGNPNANALPQWPPYDLKSRATMIFILDSQPRVERSVSGDPPNPAGFRQIGSLDDVVGIGDLI